LYPRLLSCDNFPPNRIALAYKAMTVAFIVLLSACAFQETANFEQHELEQQALADQLIAVQQQRDGLAQSLADLKKQKAQLAKEKQALVLQQTEFEQEKNRWEVLRKSPNTERSNQTPITQSIVTDGPSVLLGAVEPVYLDPPGLWLDARMDTGATTSSLNALNLARFERDGESFVKFDIINSEDGQPITLERRIIENVRIKSLEGESSVRPVVRLRAIIGTIDQRVEFTLIDRSSFQYQVLIGRNFIRDFAVIDVSKRRLSKSTKE